MAGLSDKSAPDGWGPPMQTPRLLGEALTRFHLRRKPGGAGSAGGHGESGGTSSGIPTPERSVRNPGRNASRRDLSSVGLCPVILDLAPRFAQHPEGEASPPSPLRVRRRAWRPFPWGNAKGCRGRATVRSEGVACPSASLRGAARSGAKAREIRTRPQMLARRSFQGASRSGAEAGRKTRSCRQPEGPCKESRQARSLYLKGGH